MGSIIGSTVLSEPRATPKAHGVDHVYLYCLLKLPSNEYNANTGLITPPQKVGRYLLASFLDDPLIISNSEP